MEEVGCVAQRWLRKSGSASYWMGSTRQLPGQCRAVLCQVRVSRQGNSSLRAPREECQAPKIPAKTKRCNGSIGCLSTQSGVALCCVAIALAHDTTVLVFPGRRICCRTYV